MSLTYFLNDLEMVPVAPIITDIIIIIIIIITFHVRMLKDAIPYFIQMSSKYPKPLFNKCLFYRINSYTFLL